jgi:catechol 2,3-dioxygenase-like lactoylglutathione lyase family enzyme
MRLNTFDTQLRTMKIRKIVETCIYARDLTAAAEFYGDILGLKKISAEENRHIFFKCGDGMLLIFNPDHTAHEQTSVNGEPVPLHGATGSIHLAFGVDEEEYPKWKNRLGQFNIEIESEVQWANGFSSIYFRDPAGNSIEFVSPELWS